MHERLLKRAIAVLLVLCMCLSCFPSLAFAEEGEEETRSWTGTEEQTLEDASAQLGEYTPPAADPEQEAEPPAEEPEREAETQAEAPEQVSPAEEPAEDPTPTETEALRDPEPEEPKTLADNADLADGRDNAGDVKLTANRIVDGAQQSTNYILLGNKRQFELLQTGSNINATGPIWRLEQEAQFVGSGLSTRLEWVTTSKTLAYPGDADLETPRIVVDDSGSVVDFSGYDFYGQNYSIQTNVQNHRDNGKTIGSGSSELATYSGKTRVLYCGGTLTEPDESILSYTTGSTAIGSYSNEGNFVLFRDLPAFGSWTPMMFYGTMIGAKLGENASGLTLAEAVTMINKSTNSEQYENIVDQPTIDGVRVNIPSTKLIDPDDYVGVGFFATLSSSRPGSDLDFSNPRTEVRNLEFADIEVINNAGGIQINQTVLSGVTELLGGTVGLLLDVVVRVLLRKDTGFRGMLSDLLNARAKDMTYLATGTFAGRIDGNVLVENCDLSGVKVQSAHGYTGGFVGYSTGITEYDALSGVAGELLKLLTNILNVIPGLGLGDLITIVKQTLPLDNLIPVNYWNPWIRECNVTGLGTDEAPLTIGVKSQTIQRTSITEGNFNGASLETVTLDADCNGGFIGCKVATVMIGCSIKDSHYTVVAHNYAGGFAGLARDADIQELLGGLGIDLSLRQSIMERLADANVNLQSVQVRCDILNSTITVNGDNYLGGFNGAMTNAYCINNTMDCKGKTLTVEADKVNGAWAENTGDYVGGFAGRATLGYTMSIGRGLEDPSLLGTVSSVLATLLANYGDSLLDLSGVGQSEILGLQFDFGQVKGVGGEVTVVGNHYVGGLVGEGDALIMGGATDENLEEITYIRDGDLTGQDLFGGNTRFTVSYLTPAGVPAPNGTSNLDYGNTIELANNPGALPTSGDNYKPEYDGYTEFVGWTTVDLHDTDTEPTIYAAGSTYRVTRNVTFRPVYRKAAVDIYVLMLEAPADATTWGGDYVITYGAGDELYLLTGLEDETHYDVSGSDGATALADLRDAGAAHTFLTADGRLEQVDSAYIFHAQKRGASDSSDYSFQNNAEGTYLSALSNEGVIGNPTGLYAVDSYDPFTCQWNMGQGDNRDFLFHSDNTLLPARYRYMVFDTAGEYFRLGSENEARGLNADGDPVDYEGIFFWKRTDDGPYYSTFTIGSGTSVEVPSNSKFAAMNIHGMKNVEGVKYVGGLAGLMDTASVGSVVGDTAGIAKFEIFDIEHIYVNENTENSGVSTGLTVTASDYYAGGGIGMAAGGTVATVKLYELKAVTGLNCAGGFAGAMGPGALADTGGLDVKLLGIPVLNVSNLLSVAEGLETTMEDDTVTGVATGYTVEATGSNAANGTKVFCAGGFFGRANSAIAEDCHAVRVRWVKANDTDGRAGGFIGVSQVGGLADVAGADGEGLDALRTGANSVLQASDLLGAVGYLIPSYTNVDVRFVNDSYVKGAYAGGFAADFESGTVDNSDKDEGYWYAVYNIDRVEGTLYAGGFGGKVYSGALADAAGGISVLGGVSNINITAQNLLDLVNYYIPKILYAGVNSSSDTKYEFDAQNPGPADLHNGLIVSVSGSSAMDSKSGAAGGFIGYGSGAEVSYSDVTCLRHTEVTPPAELEGKDGSSYYNTKQSSYAVTSTRYAGGYIGYMDIGSTASLGGGLGILGNNLSLTNVLDALSIVSTTIEHSDVKGALGGFAVLSGAAETGPSGGGSKGLNRDGSDIIKVYVQDNTTTSDQDFRYYIFNSGNQQHPTDWPGSKPTHFGVTEDGKNVYWFEVDAALYDRVIFTDGTYQTSDDYCLKLDHSSLSLADGIATVSNNPTSDHGWDVHYDVSDITVVKTHESCRGSYKYYNSARGVKSYVETVTNENGEHSFGDWTPVAGERRHYHECATCAYREYEDCAVASWTPIEGQNNHEGDCAKCGQHLTEACTFVAGSDHCSVCGQRSVTAEAYNVGRSGGFAGWIRGGQIQDSDCNLFSYIVGQVAAGGYAGEIEPGSVADVLGNTTVLGGLVSTESSLLSLAEGFVPTIRNSETTCIPCGGAVRADAFSDANTQRGMAGGYVGHNCGGQIWGNNTSAWKEEYDHSAANQDNNGDIISYAYTGYTKECAAIRILSVYGAEYAGGFTGLMESASTADTGSLSLLWGLIDAHNVLGALSIVYPTEENTAVYGPLYGVTQAQWDGWLAFVGQYGGYGMGMKPLSGLTLEVDGNTISYKDMTAEQKDTAFENMLKQYLYGYHVAAGRDEYSTEAIQVKGGYAGGYVGAMRTGTITNGQAWNAKQVTAMHAAGGFAGEMSAGGAAELGSVNILGLGLDLTNLLSVMNVFVPCVKESSVHGYQSGLTVCAFGAKNNNSINKFNLTHRLGDAGGYVGAVSGGQIWGDPDAAVEGETVERGCNVYNLKKVQGVNYVGGYAGSIRSGSVADVNTNTDDSLFQGILDSVISTPASLVSVLNATVSTVRYAKITVVDPDWGFTVGGWTDDANPANPIHYVPLCAGGFVGAMEGAIIGNNRRTVTVTAGGEGEDDTYSVSDPDITVSNIFVNGLRGVEGQYYAGGFVGIASEGSAASVADNKANILRLAQLENISILDVFRPYIYNADVNGVNEGFAVFTSGEESSGTMNSTRYSGCAGGFGGAVLDGHVQNSKVTKLSRVEGLNYVGGFIGHCGKGGIVDADAASLGDTATLLNAQTGIGDVIGSRVVSSSVTGIDSGYTVQATGGSEPVAGGFVGFADLAKIGFKPATLTDPEQTLRCTAVNLKLVKSDRFAGGFIGKTNKGFLVDVQASSVLLEGLLSLIRYLLKLLYVPELQQGDGLNITILGNVLSISLLDDGALGVTLLGIPIKVSLALSDTEGQSDVAKITIGDSYIELPCHYDEATGEAVIDSENPNLNIGLISAFYTTVKNSTVTGISEGYDVFAGGAEQEKDGTHRSGFAGGFVGYNQLGEISGCAVNACDTVRGTPANIGEAVQKVGPFTGFYTDESNWNSNGQAEKETNDTYKYNGSDQTHSSADNNASAVQTAPFESTAKLVLMEDTFLPANLQTMVPETADMQNPCLNSVDLTLHKIWDDMDGALGQRKDADAEHPVSVTFTVTRVSKDASGAVIANSQTAVQTVTLTDTDANPFTKNVWTKKLTGLPATGTENGAAVWYSYSVTEAALSGYVSGTEYADYDVTDKLTFGHTTDAEHTVDGGYVAKLTNQAAAEQTIVVDFGLPVSIRVMDYLKARYEYPVSGMTLAGILPVEDLENVSRYSTRLEDAELLSAALDIDNVDGEPTPEAHVADSHPRYGTFEVPTPAEGETARLRYVPGTMMFDKPVEIAVALLGSDGSYYYTKVRVIPATMIYYEAEDFIDFTGNWIDVTESSAGSGAEAEQDEDRPGADVTDYDNIYGYDDQYSNSATYSLGAAKKVTVRAGDRPTARFTFTGTGFDVLAVTNSGTGFMTVQVYQGEQGEELNSKDLVASWSVNTYYGCTRQLTGAIRYLYVWDSEATDTITGENTGCWRVAKTAVTVDQYNSIQAQLSDPEAGEPLTEEGVPVLSACPKAYTDDPDEVSLEDYKSSGFILYKLNYKWTTNPTEEDEDPVTLYQIPVITSRFTKIKVFTNEEHTSFEKKYMPYGTYTVVLKPTYTAFYDNNSAGSYDVYLDGVRIYGPAQGEAVEDCYLEDHEGWPQFIEMRRLLLGQNSFGQIPDASSSNVIYIDGGITDTNLEDFRQYGPNHEIYLEPDQAIAFSLQKGSAETLVDRLHISMKRIIPGESSQVTISCGPAADAKSAVIDLNTSSECYYDLSEVIQWNENQTGLIVISNSGASTVSLDNLKVTYSSNPVPAELDAGVTEDNLAEHYLVTVAPIQPQASVEALRLLNRAASLPIVLDDDPAFLGASVSLESDFSLHFYIPAALLADKMNPRVIFTRQTAEGPVTVCQYDYVEELVGDTLCRRYTFDSLSAAEMGTEVTARLFYNAAGVDHMSNSLSYSVRQYAVNMLGKTDDAALKTLLTDMLNYGAEAQKYFDVNTAQPVNADLTEAQQACATATEPTLENKKSLIYREGAKVWFEGCSLSLERNVTINYYLDLSVCGLSAAELVLEASWEEADGSVTTAVIEGASFETRQIGGRTLYVAVLDELNAAQMRTVVSAVVRVKSDQTCISDTMCYSIESYAQSKVTKDPALGALILAMMKYGDAAAAYFSNCQEDTE